MSWRAKLAALPLEELRGLALSLNIPRANDLSAVQLAAAVQKVLAKDANKRKKLLAFLSVSQNAEQPEKKREVVEENPTDESKQRVKQLSQANEDLRGNLKETRAEIKTLMAQLKECRREAGVLATEVGQLRKVEVEHKALLEKNAKQLVQEQPVKGQNVDTLFAHTEELEALRHEVKELHRKLNQLKSKRMSEQTKETKRLQKEKEKLKKEIKGLKMRKKGLSSTSLPPNSYVARFLLSSNGAVVAAPGRTPLLFKRSDKIYQLFIDGEEIVVIPTGKTFRFESCEKRKREELFGVVREEEGNLLIAERVLIHSAADPGDVVKAIGFASEDTAQVCKVFSEAEVINRLLGKDIKKKRKKSKGQGPKKLATNAPHVLIVGGDRVGAAYVQSLAKKSIKGEWFSGFGGLLGRERGLRGVCLVLLIVSQASHTMVAAVEKAAQQAECPLIKTSSRGKAAVVNIIVKELKKRQLLPDDE